MSAGQVLAKANAIAESQRIPANITFDLLGVLNVSFKSEQKQIYNFLIRNIDRIDRRILDGHYTYLLHRLNKRGPLQLLTRLIVLLTNKSHVSQTRIDFVTSLYNRDPDPSISRLLVKMRDLASSHIYVPVTGQLSTKDAKFPANVIDKLSSQDISQLSAVYSTISKELFAVRHSDSLTANILASLLPLISASNNVLLPVEEFVYWYLREAWPGRQTLTMIQITRLFKYWPALELPVIQRQLFDPILVKTEDSAVATIFGELSHLGLIAKPIIDALAPRLIGVGKPEHIIVFQYYTLIGEAPPKDVIQALIYTCPGGVFLCEQWAGAVEEVSTTLQGTFSLDQERLIRTMLPKLDINARFAFANAPWVGRFPSNTSTLFETSDERTPDLITEETLVPFNVSYQDFCMDLLDDLDGLGLILDGYLG